MAEKQRKQIWESWQTKKFQGKGKHEKNGKMKHFQNSLWNKSIVFNYIQVAHISNVELTQKFSHGNFDCIFSKENRMQGSTSGNQP